MSPKRRQHFLPRFYLAGFTSSGRRTDLLFVRSKAQRRTWSTRAESVAHQRDLFRPEADSVDPDHFEDAFAEVEATIAPALGRTLQACSLPVRKDLVLLLHLVALNAARPPSEIADLEDRVDQNVRNGFVERITPEQHAATLDKMRNDGVNTTGLEDLEALKDRLLGGSVRIGVNRDYLLAMGVLGRSALIVDLLGERQWSLLRAPVGENFICCDRPVAMLNNVNVPPQRYPRYEDARYDVVMPLSRGCCLVGTYDSTPRSHTAAPPTIAFINAILDSSATDYVYSTEAEYTATKDDSSAESYMSDIRDLGPYGVA